MREGYSGPLPTIGHDRGHGVTAFRVYREELYCSHWGDVPLHRLALPDKLPVIHIPRRRRFICTRCGGGHVSIRSVWPVAQGTSKPHSRR